jgi:hypothetical protein
MLAERQMCQSLFRCLGGAAGRAALLCLLAGGVALAASLLSPESKCLAEEGLASGESDISEEVLRDIERGKFMILRYDNCRGTMSSTVDGDAGGQSNFTAQFEGLYVICEPVLTHLLTRGGPMSESICDLYHIYPQRLTIRTRGRYVEYPASDMIDTFTWAKTRALVLPELATGTMTQQAVEQWHEEIRALHKERGMGAYFVVRDRRKADGDVRIMPVSFVSDPTGRRQRRTQSGKPPQTFQQPLWYTFMGDLMAFSNVGSEGVTSLDWHSTARTDLIHFPSDFSLLDLSFEHRARVPIHPAPHAGQSSANDQTLSADLFFSAGLTKEVDAIFTPYTPAEGTFMPIPDTVREYRLEVRSPDIAEVEAIRFRLYDVSDNPGICVNAKVHVLSKGGPTGCAHCKRGSAMMLTEAAQHFTGETYLPRMVSTYDDCPADELPDMYFTDTDNTAPFELSGEIVEDEQLKYKVADEVLIYAPEQTEYIAKVKFMDGAAAGKLTAELLVGGVWVPAAAMGDTADITGTFLYLPNDQDESRVADAWEEVFGDDLAEDNDDTIGGPILGDGLTSLEEYRGFVIARSFERTSPQEHDLFVTDDSGMFAAAIDHHVAPIYDSSGVRLHRVYGDESKEDVVNWTDESSRRHAQYLIVVMQHMVMPLGDDAAVNREWIDRWQTNYVGWAKPTWPQKDYHTVFVRNDQRGELAKGRTVAHEIGHQLDLPHHGSMDDTITLDGLSLHGQWYEGDYYVAVRGGQHSGNHLCIMRYACAELYCDSTEVLLPLEDHTDRYKAFLPRHHRQRTLFCDSPTGTGFNANSQWCGDATNPACRETMRIRSE